jgi:hypothetical protein
MDDLKILADAGYEQASETGKHYEDFQKILGSRVERITRCNLGYKTVYYATVLEDRDGELDSVVVSDDNLTVMQALVWLKQLR